MRLRTRYVGKFKTIPFGSDKSCHRDQQRDNPESEIRIQYRKIFGCVVCFEHFLRFHNNLGELRQTNLKWADGDNVKREVDLQLLVLLGPRTEEELAPKSKKKASAEAKKEDPKTNARVNGTANDADLTAKIEAEGADSIDELLRTRAHFHEVGKNFKTDGYVITPNTMNLLAKHVAEINGKVVLLSTSPRPSTGYFRFELVFHRNPTESCILGMPRQSTSISVMQRFD